jgi:hypothetical protein
LETASHRTTTQPRQLTNAIGDGRENSTRMPNTMTAQADFVDHHFFDYVRERQRSWDWTLSVPEVICNVN